MDDKTDNSVPVKTGSKNSASNQPANDDNGFLDEPPLNSQRLPADTVAAENHRSFFGAVFNLLMVTVFLVVLMVATALATIYVLKI